VSQWFKCRDKLGEFYICPSWRRASTVEKDWRDNIRNGDILRKGDTFRVVREAHYRANMQLNSVVMVIKHASWTGRCYTYLGRNDLAQYGFSPVKARAKMATEMDKVVNHCIHIGCDKLTPSFVKGMA